MAIDPPYRFDPFQNLVNVNFGPGLVYLRAEMGWALENLVTEAFGEGCGISLQWQTGDVFHPPIEDHIDNSHQLTSGHTTACDIRRWGGAGFFANPNNKRCLIVPSSASESDISFESNTITGGDINADPTTITGDWATTGSGPVCAISTGPGPVKYTYSPGGPVPGVPSELGYFSQGNGVTCEFYADPITSSTNYLWDAYDNGVHLKATEEGQTLCSGVLWRECGCGAYTRTANLFDTEHFNFDDVILTFHGKIYVHVGSYLGTSLGNFQGLFQREDTIGMDFST